MVKIAINEDCRVLAEMAVQMWDSHTVDELEAEFAETLNDKQSAFFIKYMVVFTNRQLLRRKGIELVCRFNTRHHVFIVSV